MVCPNVVTALYRYGAIYDIFTDLPLSFWGYALETDAFTLNRAPSKSVETTPYELWFGKKPKLSFLKVWGCDTYVKGFSQVSSNPKWISAYS